VRPSLARTRRTIARSLATLAMAVALWPGLVLAGPPVLPPTGTQGAGGPIASSAAVPIQASSFASTPVQRPAVQIQPVTPSQPRTAPVVGPEPPPVREIGPQPAPTVTPSPAPTGPAVTTTAIPTSAKPAAAPRPVVTSEASDEAPAAALVAEAEPPRKRFQHQGIVADFRIGTLGCIGALCRGGHDVSPGMRLGGFLGGNIRGWVELGVGGGWGTLSSKVAPGTNALLLYGLDPNVLQAALLAQAAGLINVDLAGLAVQGGDQLRAAQLGPSMRIHLLPRGRFGAFVGSGVGYNVLRARYQTALGDVGMAFHGIDVPVEANFSVYVHEHIAVGLQFDYMWTWYGLAVLDHPQQKIPIPMRLLQGTPATQGVDVREQLPQFWTLGLAIRGRL